MNAELLVVKKMIAVPSTEADSQAVVGLEAQAHGPGGKRKMSQQQTDTTKKRRKEELPDGVTDGVINGVIDKVFDGRIDGVFDGMNDEVLAGCLMGVRWGRWAINGC